MNTCNLQSLDFSVTEKLVRSEYLHEVRAEVHSLVRSDFIACFSATLRTSGGEQVLNTSSQFVQREYLSRDQIDAVTQWLRDSAISARWRLTTYAALVEAHP